jgi:hypothetical protein
MRPVGLVLAGAAFAVVLASPVEIARAAVAPRVRVMVRPGAIRLGERATYRAELIVVPGTDVKWIHPEAGGAFTWGEARSGRRAGAIASSADTAWVEIALQVFELGVASIPGVRFESGADSALGTRREGRVPTARLVVLPVLTPADSEATLREVHGPLSAPWWERIAWRWVAAIAALLAAAALLVAWWRRPRGVSEPAAPAASPAETALAALAELRAERLPDQGKSPEHAFRLGQILRRFLEATLPVTRPGDTTPQLVARLADAAMSADDLRRLAELLRAWDRVKFARQPSTPEEAARGEEAVEAFLRQSAAGEPQPRVA